MHIRLYVLYVKSLIGGVPRMGSRVPFALLPFGVYIYLSNKVLIITGGEITHFPLPPGCLL